MIKGNYFLIKLVRLLLELIGSLLKLTGLSNLINKIIVDELNHS